MAFDWTDARIKRLTKLWLDGTKVATIRHEFGCSKGTITGKVKRLDLPRRPSPFANGPAPARKPVPPKRAPRTTLPSFGGPPQAASRTPPTPVLLSTKPCCWPIGEPRSKAFRFCDEPAVFAKPYCLEHSKQAYAKYHEVKEIDQRTEARPQNR
jgi:GcrA cell cycle regulator